MPRPAGQMELFAGAGGTGRGWVVAIAEGQHEEAGRTRYLGLGVGSEAEPFKTTFDLDDARVLFAEADAQLLAGARVVPL